ncbi:MAG TPA: cysteine--tRNA ligase [Firmicutes bacterium]|nr:cysteine--tRNA ligase [Bacillota bacterium]
MIVYNTLTRRKEELVTVHPGEVRMYSCGPTVYSRAHMGNMRAYIFMDTLRRVIKFNGYKLLGVMNITDVGHLTSDADDGDDKMEKAAKKTGKSPWEIAEHFTKLFFEDTDKLNIERPEIVAKATDHIADMLEFVEALVEKGYGYETSDGIYFDISKFPSYGKLSGNTRLSDNIAGARVDVNDEKRNPADFALWKKAPKEHIMQWDSPWGRSYPGWHIECSTMSRKYLGDTFDIHTGGVDHIPIHHENEIAQSEALLGHPAVHYWMHVEFMQVDGRKMSKSLGNTYTLDELEEKGYSPMDFRYFCLNTHYRKKLNFTFEGMDGAKTAYSRLLALVGACKHAESGTTDPEIIRQFDKAFLDAVSDDLNIPLGLGELWTLLKNPPSRDIYDAAMRADKVLALSIDKCDEKKDDDVPADIRDIAERRFAARKAKNWAESDALRAELAEKGWSVADSKDGYSLKKN